MKLFAHERWMANAVVRRQAAVRSSRVLRIEQRFGSDGVQLLAAGMSTVVAGELLALVGAALLAVLIAPAVVLLGLGTVVVLLSVVRFVQAARAGRLFRNSALT